MLKLWKSTPVPSHEELFIEHYEQLLAWSLQLTGHDRQKAEDLVHDVFIQFTLIQPALNEIENLGGYLFAMLRNLLRSQMRGAARGGDRVISLVDYESAEIGLRSADPLARLQARDELRAICRYACARKETSKCGSVLILRYFLGYYPSEIRFITRSSSQAVDFLLSSARREARLSLSQPERLKIMKDKSPPLPAHWKSPEHGDLPEHRDLADDFLGELAREIFQSCHGTCLTQTQLRAIYEEAGPRETETKMLAHIVSCPRCLEVVNRMLGGPPLAERYPTDTLGPDRRDRGDRDHHGGGRTGGGSGAGSAWNAVGKFRRRLREVIEHEPKELRLAVNGQALGTLTVSAGLNKLNLHLDETEKIAFIEVFSEQGLRLFFLNVAPPPEGAFVQEAQAGFSRQRTLTIALRFNGPGAELEMVYLKPAVEPEAATSPITLVAVKEAPAGETDKAEPPPHRLPAALDSLRSRLFGSSFWSRPATLTALALLILSAALLFYRPSERKVSAAELLGRATVSEASLTSRADLALHRTLSLEERDPASGQILSRRRIEVWQSAGRGLKARRLYDEQNRLIAGEWQRADGSRAVYRKPKAGLEPQSSIRNLEVWQLEPSAQDFAAAIGWLERATFEEMPSAYVISYQPGTDGGAGVDSALLKAMLTLRKPDLLAVEQTLVVRREAQTREYRLIESRFERYPDHNVAPGVFEPEPELLSLSRQAPDRIKDGVGQVLRMKPEAGSLAPALPSAVATTGLEVEVLRLLSQARADLGEQVSVTRTSDGKLRVEGLLDTDARKAEILRALNPVGNHPLVRLEIKTVAEALRRQQPLSPSGAVPVEATDAAGKAIPLHLELRRYFAGQPAHDRRAANAPPVANADEEVRQFATRMLARSNRTLSHAWAMRRLIERFSPETLRGLEAETRAKWLAMIREHAWALEQEITGLRRELEPIFFTAAPPAEATAEEHAEGEITDEAALTRAVARLFELTSAHNQAVRLAFAISSAPLSTAPDVKSPQFRRSLRGAERLAAKIAGAMTNAK